MIILGLELAMLVAKTMHFHTFMFFVPLAHHGPLVDLSDLYSIPIFLH